MVMESSELHLLFKALGDPTRLKIFNYLRSCNQPVSIDDAGEARIIDGPTAGDVCCTITGSERVTSTLSFHLKELRNAKLITMERRGKHQICSINPVTLQNLQAFVSSDFNASISCCND